MYVYVLKVYVNSDLTKWVKHFQYQVISTSRKSCVSAFTRCLI